VRFGVSKGLDKIKDRFLNRPINTGASRIIGSLGRSSMKMGGALSLTAAGVAAGGLYMAKKSFDGAARRMQDSPYVDQRRRMQGQNINDTPSIRRRLGASGEMVLRNAKR